MKHVFFGFLILASLTVVSPRANSAQQTPSATPTATPKPGEPTDLAPFVPSDPDITCNPQKKTPPPLNYDACYLLQTERNNNLRDTQTKAQSELRTYCLTEIRTCRAKTDAALSACRANQIPMGTGGRVDTCAKALNSCFSSNPTKLKRYCGGMREQERADYLQKQEDTLRSRRDSDRSRFREVQEQAEQAKEQFAEQEKSLREDAARIRNEMQAATTTFIQEAEVLKNKSPELKEAMTQVAELKKRLAQLEGIEKANVEISYNRIINAAKLACAKEATKNVNEKLEVRKANARARTNSFANFKALLNQSLANPDQVWDQDKERCMNSEEAKTAIYEALAEKQLKLRAIELEINSIKEQAALVSQTLKSSIDTASSAEQTLRRALEQKLTEFQRQLGELATYAATLQAQFSARSQRITETLAEASQQRDETQKEFSNNIRESRDLSKRGVNPGVTNNAATRLDAIRDKVMEANSCDDIETYCSDKGGLPPRSTPGTGRAR
ncbi:MAG: hypothetical protein SGI74_14120 [Oligoflexia bacterium]|nr:hypothetical protein [Oligoflexia bacterium]